MSAVSPKYQPLLDNEDHDEEIGHHNQEPRRLKPSWMNIMSYKWAFWALLTLVTLGAGSVILHAVQNDSVELRSERFFPKFGHRRVTFTKGREFENTLPKQENSPWNQLLPMHSYGFVKVTNPGYYNVSGGLPFDIATNKPMPHLFGKSGKQNDTEIYTISMFHQLHCLIVIRDTFMTVNAEGKIVAGIDVPFDKISNDHLNHCFDYIRQAILCAGDTALDRYAYDDSGPKLQYGVNGLGTTHLCRDVDAIYKFEASHAWKRNEGPEMEHEHHHR